MDATTTFTLGGPRRRLHRVRRGIRNRDDGRAGSAPWGAIRGLAGVAFSVGLILVVAGRDVLPRQVFLDNHRGLADPEGARFES